MRLLRNRPRSIPAITTFSGAVEKYMPRARAIAEALLPSDILNWLRAKRSQWATKPRPGSVRFGHLRRLTPISRVFGYDRGRPVDRYYIENFLAAHAEDIHGNVLEVADNTYTRKFGGPRVKKADVLHAMSGNPQATIVADLTRADRIPSDAFDCIILTQTLQYLYDVHAVIRTIYRILRPGGVVLATLPGIAQIDRGEANNWGEWWRFTKFSAQRLFSENFPAERVTVESHGNVLIAIALLHGLAAEELRREEFACHDPNYEVIITVRAQKPSVQ